MDQLMLSQDGQAGFAIGLAQDQQAMQFMDRTQFLIIQPDQDIVHLDAGLGGSRIFLDGYEPGCRNAGAIDGSDPRAQWIETSWPATPI